MVEMDPLNDAELDAVTGGTGSDPAPTATGGASYKCPACGMSITASTRDTAVTCPNLKCRRQYQIKNGKLVATANGQ